MVAAFEKACGHAIKYEIKERRPGDISTCYCDPSKAKAELGWEAQYGIDEMCADSWNGQKKNPNGYNDEFTFFNPKRTEKSLGLARETVSKVKRL